MTFDDVRGERDTYTNKQGWQKIQKCCAVALRDRFKYVWVDTCCIDKRSSAELSEAINSMYCWYDLAEVCYVYLFDVDSIEDVKGSTWFLRSWTLQELLASRKVIFFDAAWSELGDKLSLRRMITAATSIPDRALENFLHNEHSIAQRMSWAAKRKATRIEDIAYSLLGIFDVNMPLLYGEGEKAFERLQEEIIRYSNDASIFTWTGDSPSSRNGMLARSPEGFIGGGSCHALTLGQGYNSNNAGITIDLELQPLLLDQDYKKLYYAYLHGPKHRRCRKFILGKSATAQSFQRVLSLDITPRMNCLVSGLGREQIQLLISRDILHSVEPKVAYFIIPSCPRGVRLYVRSKAYQDIPEMYSPTNYWHFVKEGQGETLYCEVPTRKTYGMVGYVTWRRLRFGWQECSYVFAFGQDFNFDPICLAFQSPVGHCENPLSIVDPHTMMQRYTTLLPDSSSDNMIFDPSLKMYAAKGQELSNGAQHMVKLNIWISFGSFIGPSTSLVDGFDVNLHRKIFDINSKEHPLPDVYELPEMLPKVTWGEASKLHRMIDPLGRDHGWQRPSSI